MNGIEVLNYVNILFIWCLALALIWVVSRMKFSLYVCFGRLLFYNDASCYKWLMGHKYYLYSFVTIIILIALSIGLLSQAYDGMIKIRTEYTICTSILLWSFLCPLILSLFMKAHRNEE